MTKSIIVLNFISQSASVMKLLSKLSEAKDTIKTGEKWESLDDP